VPSPTMTRGASPPRRSVGASDRRRDHADLRAYVRDRDPTARERLVRDFLPLAHAIAWRFHRGGADQLEDLQQVAALGLIKALERFDPDKGVAFSSFAVPTIQGEIRRYFRDFTWAVRPPRDLLENALRVDRERERLASELGRSPTTAELAARLDVAPEDIVDGLLAAQARTSDSLDRPVARDDEAGATLGDSVGTDDPGFTAAEYSAMADELLGTLSERDAHVVRLRFNEDLTQSQIAERIGCSQMHVSRILRRVLARLYAVASTDPVTQNDLDACLEAEPDGAAGMS